MFLFETENTYYKLKQPKVPLNTLLLLSKKSFFQIKITFFISLYVIMDHPKVIFMSKKFFFFSPFFFFQKDE